MTKSGKQMSQLWIDRRLKKSVKEQDYFDILDNGYDSVLAKVDNKGKVDTYKLDDKAKIISKWY